MSEVDMAVIKPELMKSYIWLQTADGSIQQVEQEAAMFCPMICHEVIQKSMGSSKNNAISLPQRVNPAMLSLILDYCRFHQVSGRSNKERKSFDEKFIRMDTKRLCELTSAADGLQLKPLVDLTSRALARIIEGKSPEEIREIFHLPDDLTEEEKLEPLKNTTDDPRIRLLNRLYAKKRKELKEREKLKNVEVEEERVDDRSVDDLLSFINGDSRDSKGIKTSKSKKKNRRRKDQQKSTSGSEATKNHNKEPNGLNSVCRSAEVGQKIQPSFGATSNLQDAEDDIFANKNEFDDADIDDEIDPALKEKIDREVEDFARRLNPDWPERMQEILSFGQERKPAHFSLNGNGSNVEVEEERVDDRSVDDLLSFINGDSRDSKGIKTSKSKKKNRRRKDQQKSTSGSEATKNHNKEPNGLNSVCRSAEVGQKIQPSFGATSNLQDAEDDIFANKNEFDDADIDDEIDPALKEKIDREVEDFARRLNSDWPERMQEILSFGQERKPAHFTLNGNGSIRSTDDFAMRILPQLASQPGQF